MVGMVLMVQLGQNTKIQRPLFWDGVSTSVNLTPLDIFNKTECGGDGGDDTASWEDCQVRDRCSNICKYETAGYFNKVSGCGFVGVEVSARQKGCQARAHCSETAF